jgi:hypothetical protein
MNRIIRSGVLILLLAVAGPALAGEYDSVPPVTHGATKKECGECHMAFQPALLPAAGWTRLMANLGDHFGEDTELAPELVADIRAYLTANAGPGDPGPIRITEQRWWLRKHRKVRGDVWQRPDIKSKINCEACHRDAARGVYDDDD